MEQDIARFMSSECMESVGEDMVFLSEYILHDVRWSMTSAPGFVRSKLLGVWCAVGAVFVYEMNC